MAAGSEHLNQSSSADNDDNGNNDHRRSVLADWLSAES